MIEIKHKTTGEVLCKVDAGTLRGADLTYAKLADANLTDADLTDADLRYADLKGANLMGADLAGVNLWCADLRFADLADANLKDANLAGAKLEGANLRRVIGIVEPASPPKEGGRESETPDRLPTEADANEEGNVYLVGANMLARWDGVVPGEVWSPLPRFPKSRDELVQDLLDAIDNCNGVCIDEEWRKVNEAREALR